MEENVTFQLDHLEYHIFIYKYCLILLLNRDSVVRKIWTDQIIQKNEEK
jgi:hypothetical protein